MRAPESLETLIEYGIIQEVLRPLMSGKEAQVFVVHAGGQEAVAKVYKEAHQRTFKHRSDYKEGRRTRNSRDQRAMNKRSQHGRKKDEEAWRSAEVEMIYRLRDAGVRVPEPLNFVEGVLVMELVKDGAGSPAPRLGDLDFSPTEAVEIYDALIREVVRMLCAGVVHGDLSEFNVLMASDGPVVIDFPQAIDATSNSNARKLLLRDVQNLHRFVARFAPDAPIRPYGEEMWGLYEKNRLRPDTELRGHYDAPKGKVDTDEVMALIDDASREHRRRRGGDTRREDGAEQDVRSDPGSEEGAPKPFRRVVDFSSSPASKRSPKKSSAKKRSARTRGKRSGRSDRRGTEERVPPPGPARTARADEGSGAGAAPAKEAPKRSRRRRRRSGGSDGSSVAKPKSEGDAKAPKRKPTSASAPRGGRGPRDDSDGDRPPRVPRRRRARRPKASS
jgi:RIO kinase 1